MDMPDQEYATLKWAYKRVVEDGQRWHSAGICHGEHITDAGELEFDIDFDGVRAAVEWAEMLRDQYGIHAQFRDVVGSMWQSLVLAVTITEQAARRMMRSTQSPNAVTVDGDTFVIDHGCPDEIVFALTLTRWEKDYVEMKLSQAFQTARKQKQPGQMDRIRKLLIKLDPTNAKTYADEPVK